MLVWKDDKLLFEERNIKPYGLAPPTGHVDNHGLFKIAAIAELEEEVGLDVEDIE